MKPGQIPPPTPRDTRLAATQGSRRLAYTGQLRGPGSAPTAILGILLAFASYFAVTPFVSLAVTAAASFLLEPDTPFADFQASAARYQSPAGLAATGIAVAALIPVCWLLMTRFHRVRFGQLSSVEGRLRWRYLAICLGIALVIILGGTLLLAIIQGQPLRLAPEPGWWGFLLVVAVVTPWQSAAEEYLFRGYLLQALGSLARSPWVGAVSSSLLFASLHGTQNMALFVDRFAFGLLASGLVILTGGLEAGIAAHIINNVGAYSIATLTSSVAQLREVRALTWADALIDVAIFATFAATAFAMARLLRLRSRVDPSPIAPGSASSP